MDNTPAHWFADGIGIDKAGMIVVRASDNTSFISVTPDYLRECVERREEFARRLAEAEEKLKYSEPTRFVPQMIRDLETKAEESDKLKQGLMGAAYSDAARMLRKALREG